MLNISTLTSLYNIELIIEFGNISNPIKNDIDLLIVSDDFEDMFKFKREKLIKGYIVSNTVIDPICITGKEFERLVTSNSLFAKQILKGEILYDSRNKRGITRACKRNT